MPPEDYDPKVDIGSETTASTERPIPRDFTQMLPSDLPRAEARENEWYGRRNAELQRLDDLGLGTRVLENQPPSKPTLSDEVSRKLLGPTATSLAEWVLPFQSISDASYALGSGNAPRMAIEGSQELANIIAGLLLPKGLGAAWRARPAMPRISYMENLPGHVTGGTTETEDRWLR